MVTKSQTAETHDAAARADVGEIRVFSSLDDARGDWEALAQSAPASPYQTWRFASAWDRTIGRARAEAPFIVVLRVNGIPRALLPLTLTRLGPLRVARFIGGRESNLNLPLVDPRLDAARVVDLLSAVAAHGVDLLDLNNMPRRLDGYDNPLVLAQAQPSPSFAYGLTLPQTQEELAQNFSNDARKKLRNKEARLKARGSVHYEHRALGPRADEILTALIAQKTARFDQMGLRGFFNGPMRAFLARLVEDETLELHALRVDDRVVATYAGVARDGRFSTTLNSFDMDEDIARSSPADMLLHALLRDLVSRGMAHFDLGVGEARYKSAVCKETIELCDVIAPLTAKGRMAAPLLALARAAKRRIKRTPALMRMIARARVVSGKL